MKIKDIDELVPHVANGHVVTILEKGLRQGLQGSVPNAVGVRVRRVEDPRCVEVVRAQEISHRASPQEVRDAERRAKSLRWRQEVVGALNEKVGSCATIRGGEVFMHDSDLRRIAAAAGVDVGTIDLEVGA